MTIAPKEIYDARILIVDDKASNVELLQTILETAGYTSVTATQFSTEVCGLHQTRPYDLILLDLQMPGMNLFQVMENLKQVETPRYLPVLVITAQAEHRLRALEAGVKDFISKPFEVAEVLSRVYNMLEMRLLQFETKELREQLASEHKISERLLFKLLPESIVECLQEHSEVSSIASGERISDTHAELTLLFADIVEFSNFSKGASAQVLRGVLRAISEHFESIAARGFDRSESLGDAYLAALRLPGPIVDHTIRAAEMALDLSESLARYNRHSRHKLRVQIGLVAHVKGRSKALYDL
jgi:adenylate cyclase